MIDSFKSWITRKPGISGTTYNAEATFRVMDYHVVEEVYSKVVNSIAEKFLEQNAEAIKRDILDNPKFADAVYNAIVLKKVSKELP